MLALIAMLFLIPGSQASSSAPAANTCVACHAQVGGDLAAPIDKVKDDVHGKHGLSCVSCHGGDATQMDMDRAMDSKKGFVKPTSRQVAAFCGKCHSNAETMKQFNPSLRVDQESLY